MIFVQRVAGAAAIGAAMLVGASLSAPPAQAAFIATLMQEGPNVVATGSGTIDLAGLSLFGFAAISAASVAPNLGQIVIGQPGSSDLYFSVAGPKSFGSGGETDASTASEAIVGIFFPKGVPFSQCRQATSPAVPCLTARPGTAPPSPASA